MNTAFARIAIILATSAWSLAAPAGPVPPAPPADPVASTCLACHGEQGQGASRGVPRLAGLDAQYLDNALSMFRAGTRASTVMQPIARSLDDTEIKGVADYFSKQNAPLADAALRAPATAVLAGRRLAEQGAANLPACFSCHAPQGKGNGARFPAIAGQPSKYVVDRLHEFQARAQGKPAPPGSMTAVAAKMNQTQIAAAAAYLSQLAP
jgi:cytochrome c553